jgi:hypothetical protein
MVVRRNLQIKLLPVWKVIDLNIELFTEYPVIVKISVGEEG